jgi:ABC-type multidrug transport system fused ATPase/permease subunit
MSPSPAGPGVRAAWQATLTGQFWDALSTRRRRAAVAGLCVMLAAGASELGMLVALKVLLVDVLHAAGGVQVYVPALWLAASVVMVCIARLATLELQDRLVLGFASDASLEIFSRALRQPYLEHAKRESAELFAILENMQRLVNGSLGPLVQCLVSAALAAVLLAYLLVAAPLVVLGLLVLLALTWLAVGSFTGTRAGAGSPTLQALAKRRLKVVHEAQRGFRDLVLAHEQARVEGLFRQAEEQYRGSQARDRFRALGPRHVVEMVVVLVAIGLILLLSDRPGGVAASIPAIGVVALGLQRLIPLISSCNAGWRLFQANGDVLEDTLRLMRTPALPIAEPVPTPMTFQHAIELQDVTLRHDERNVVLRDVSIRIGRGERIAIVGPSGSGKSSLLDIILGLIEPTAGRVLIDGVPLDSHAKRWAWQEQLACVGQEVYLRDASILEVITDASIDRAAEPQRFEQAVRGARLDGFIASLPQGALTRIGDGGALLSGGQRQRIAIARALYRRARVLVLDEATSQLDATSEAAFLDTLDSIGAAMTILIVTHRESTLRGCDRVLVVGEGRVLEPAAGTVP